MSLLAILLLIGLLLLFIGTEAAVKRSRAPIRAFRATHPCPATGKLEVDTPCRTPDGRVRYVVDHKYPLCAGGADTPENMQWQEYRESLVKDRIELELCRVRAQLGKCQSTP